MISVAQCTPEIVLPSTIRAVKMTVTERSVFLSGRLRTLRRICIIAADMTVSMSSVVEDG